MTAANFRELHQPGNPFILANAWDVGSAKIMAAFGAKALASTSAGHAFVTGVKDMGYISREMSLAHCRELVCASRLPVSADLENGYSHQAEEVGQTIVAAASTGLAGCGIEDTKLPDTSAYEFSHAVERIEAAVDAVRSLGRDFVLTARADGMLTGQYGIKEAIRRLQAFEAVGADVLYAPMPKDMNDLALICKSVKSPVNVLASGPLAQFKLKQFAKIGVARVSLGSAFSRSVHTTLLSGAKQIFEHGDFSSFTDAASVEDFEELFDKIQT